VRRNFHLRTGWWSADACFAVECVSQYTTTRIGNESAVQSANHGVSERTLTESDSYGLCPVSA